MWHRWHRVRWQGGTGSHGPPRPPLCLLPIEAATATSRVPAKGQPLPGPPGPIPGPGPVSPLSAARDRGRGCSATPGPGPLRWPVPVPPGAGAAGPLASDGVSRRWCGAGAGPQCRRSPAALGCCPVSPPLPSPQRRLPLQPPLPALPHRLEQRRRPRALPSLAPPTPSTTAVLPRQHLFPLFLHPTSPASRPLHLTIIPSPSPAPHHFPSQHPFSHLISPPYSFACPAPHPFPALHHFGLQHLFSNPILSLNTLFPSPCTPSLHPPCTPPLHPPAPQPCTPHLHSILPLQSLPFPSLGHWVPGVHSWIWGTLLALRSPHYHPITALSTATPPIFEVPSWQCQLDPAMGDLREDMKVTHLESDVSQKTPLLDTRTSNSGSW